MLIFMKGTIFMNSNIIGNTMIYVVNPYEIYEHGFHFQNLSNFISKVEIEHSILESFYDKNSSRGYTSYFFAKNILESINDDTITKWADFSDKYYDTNLEDYLMKLVSKYWNDSPRDILDEIPLNNSPIITLSKEAISNYVFGKEDNAVKSFRFPEEGIGLFTELAKLELFEISSLKKFTKSFGIPIGVDISKKSEYSALIDFKQYNTFLYFGAAPTALIYKELVEYQNIFNMFVAVKTNDEQLANKIYERKRFIQAVSELSSISINRSSEIQTFKREYEKNILDNKNKFSLAQCRKYLTEAITEKVAINTKITDSVDGDFFEVKLYNNLFEVAYNQIKNSLLNNTELKRCENCGHIFESTHGKQRFCSPLPFKKRSSCENNYNQRLKRNKEKALSLVELGNSIEEISQIINESPETIQQWIINKVN